MIFAFFQYAILHLIVDIIYLFIITPYINRILNKNKSNDKSLYEKLISGIISYLIIILAFWNFILKDLHKKSVFSIIFQTTLLSLCIWGVYNLTNFVFINEYPKKLAIIDISWGILSSNFIILIFRWYIHKKQK